MVSCPKCGKKMMQEAEACDACWLKSDLAEAEKRIETLAVLLARSGGSLHRVTADADPSGLAGATGGA